MPTMGALHAGHLRLIRQAALQCKQVFVSLYVNPTQFGVNEDLSTYPRELDKDLSKIDHLNVDLSRRGDAGSVTVLFRPDTEAMYPFGLDSPSYVSIDPSMTQVLEGRARPTFFRGVTTVVMKLLNIVQPTAVYFGQKDFQQLAILRRMVNEFHVPTKVRAVATVRFNGLALSSRNAYLGERRRQVATALYSAITAGLESFASGERNCKTILDAAILVAQRKQDEQRTLSPTQRARFEVDYLSLVDPYTLNELDGQIGEQGAVLSGAIIMLPLEDRRHNEELGIGEDARPVRLIDNAILGNSDALFGPQDGSDSEKLRWTE